MSPRRKPEHLERCDIRVQNGIATARYRWAHLRVDGHIQHDEDVTGWTDQDVLNVMANLIGIDTPKDRAVMRLVWD